MPDAEIDSPAVDAGASAKKRPRKRSRKSKGGATAADTDGASAAATQVGAAPSGGSTQPQGAASASSSSQAASKSGPSSTMRMKPQPQPQPPSAPTSAHAPTLAPAPAILTSNPHKPSVLPRPSVFGPRQYTLSVALPSSIVLNAQTMELKTRLVGSIARICAVFNVDEVVVFNDGHATAQEEGAHFRGGGAGAGAGPEAGSKRSWEGDEERQGYGPRDRDRDREPFDADSFTSMIFQYLETPPYMRKSLFPMHPHLRLAGLLPPLDLPHHLRLDEDSPYREGLVVDAGGGGSGGYEGRGGRSASVWVNVGFREPLECILPANAKGTGQVPQQGARVTVEMPQGGHSKGRLVSPRASVQSQGLYWGYSVRLARSLSQVFTGCPFSGDVATLDPASASTAAVPAAAEYDLVIGTAERGDALTDVLYATERGSPVSSSKAQSGANSYRSAATSSASADAPAPTVPPLPRGFAHALILFGGLSGLEVAIERDEGIPLGRGDAHELCDFWVDVCEGQGSRTVRTEEAITITLARLKTALEQLGRR